MRDRREMEIKYFHTLGGPESKRLKVAALNLFHPTASPPFAKGPIFHIATQPLGKEGVGLAYW